MGKFQFNMSSFDLNLRQTVCYSLPLAQNIICLEHIKVKLLLITKSVPVSLLPEVIKNIKLVTTTTKYFSGLIIVTALMDTRGSSVKQIGTNAGVGHVSMAERASMALPCTIALVPKALVVR
jgi:hypothetical protein